VWEEWYDNGQMKEKKTFENGCPVGTITRWYETGGKQYESIILDKNKYHSTFYYPTGEKETMFISNTVDGNVIKNCKTYYMNGQLALESTERNEKLHGSYVEWYENGLKKCEGVYVNGKETGLWRKWYRTGELKSEMSYVNEKEICMRRLSKDGSVLSTKYKNEVAECCTIV
jgi:uncharacterized protein